MRYETVDILFPIRVQKVGTDIDETYVILRMRERLVIDSSSQFIGCQTFQQIRLILPDFYASGRGFPPLGAAVPRPMSLKVLTVSDIFVILHSL